MSAEKSLEKRLDELEIAIAELKVLVETQGRLTWAMAGTFIVGVAVALITR